jgi:hypothetical protein
MLWVVIGIVNYPQLHMRKTVQPVSFRLTPEVKAAAEKAAAEDQRSLSSLIQKLLIDYLRKKGYLKS